MNEAVSPDSRTAEDKPPLDDMMLAMDVVDTLRRRERLVLRELDEAGREQDLKQRLKRIYAQQGISVPEQVIEQGVAALREERFVYQPLQRGLGRKLAMLYIRRGKWGKWVGGVLAALIAALAVNYFLLQAPQRALPQDLQTRHAEVVRLAVTDRARERAEQLLSRGHAALRREDTAAAEAALSRLEQLRNTLEQEYSLRIVSQPGQPSGIWRVPDVNTNARNYYLVVEAVDPTGKRLVLPVENEETGQTERVGQWGLRVDEATFNRVRRDKEDDGIIQGSEVGVKKRGYIEPEFSLPTTGAAITSW